MVERVYVEGAGDKGVSAGENSQVDINEMNIKKSKAGIVSKDLSEVFSVHNRIEDCDIGYAVYQKKPEYGPATINILGGETKNIGELYLVEEGSLIVENGTKFIKGKIKNLAERLL